MSSARRAARAAEVEAARRALEEMRAAHDERRTVTAARKETLRDLLGGVDRRAQEARQRYLIAAWSGDTAARDAAVGECRRALEESAGILRELLALSTADPDGEFDQEVSLLVAEHDLDTDGPRPAS